MGEKKQDTDSNPSTPSFGSYQMQKEPEKKASFEFGSYNVMIPEAPEHEEETKEEKQQPKQTSSFGAYQIKKDQPSAE